MDTLGSNLIGSLLGVLFLVAAPLIAVAISVMYFLRSDSNANLLRRVISSAHGVTIAIIYAIAFAITLAGYAEPPKIIPFVVALLVPVALILISLFDYPGNSRIHRWQVLNVACLLWTWFMGSMAITGDWL